MSEPERKTLSLKRPVKISVEHRSTSDLLAEIENLRRQLDSAKQELLAWQRKSLVDGELPVLKHKAFDNAVVHRTKERRQDGGGCLARVALSNLADLLKEHGDEAADHAIHHVATHLAGHLRDTDVVGRVGTGSFAVLLAFANMDGAAAKMGRLTSKIEELPCQFKGTTLPVRLEYSVTTASEFDHD